MLNMLLVTCTEQHIKKTRGTKVTLLSKHYSSAILPRSPTDIHQQFQFDIDVCYTKIINSYKNLAIS